MKTLLEILVFYCVCCTSIGLEIIWDNSADTNLNEVDSDLLRSQNKMHIPNWFFIFPGTKWCGAGNIAENDNDFGTERDTDKCCRNHDYCPEQIDGHQTKYNLTNPNFYTRSTNIALPLRIGYAVDWSAEWGESSLMSMISCSQHRLHCDCDKEFYRCLKSVNTKASNQVGQIYFTALGTQCYKKDFPISGCNKYTYFPRPKCVEYTFDESQETKYQWFDIPNF